MPARHRKTALRPCAPHRGGQWQRVASSSRIEQGRIARLSPTYGGGGCGVILLFALARRGFGVRGLLLKCLGPVLASAPAAHNRMALPQTAERGRCRRLPICDAEFVGHRLISSRISSLVHGRIMASLVVHSGPSVLKDRLRRLRADAALNPAERPARRQYPTVLPKFRNPDEPHQTWSGRGKRPLWITELLDAGRSIQDFQISEATSSPS